MSSHQQLLQRYLNIDRMTLNLCEYFHNPFCMHMYGYILEIN